MRKIRSIGNACFLMVGVLVGLLHADEKKLVLSKTRPRANRTYQHGVRKIHLDWLEEYDAFSKDSPKTKTTFKALYLRGIDNLFEYGAFGEQLPVAKDAKTLLKTAGLDSFARVWCARFVSWDSEESGETVMKRLLPAFDKILVSTYSLSARVTAGEIVTTQMDKYVVCAPSMKIKRRYQKQYESLLLEWLTTDTIGADDATLRFVFRRFLSLMDNSSPSQKELVKLPDVLVGAADPWLVNMVRGRVLEKIAWYSRGQGTSRHVGANQWKGFHAGLKGAAKYYMKALELRPSCPESAFKMVGVSHHTNGFGKPMDWYAKVCAIEVDNRSAYDTLLYYGAPKWGGSVKFMLDAANKMADTKRYDTQGPLFLLFGIFKVTVYKKGWRDPRVIACFPKFVEMCNGYHKWQAAHPNHYFLHKNYMPTVHLSVSYAMDRYDEIKTVYDRFGERCMDPCVLKMMQLTDYDCALIFLMTGKARERTKAYVDLRSRSYNSFFTAETQAQLRQAFDLLKNAAKDDLERAKSFIESNEALFERAATFRAGKKVSLSFEHGRAAWHIVKGSMDVKDAATAVVTHDPKGMQYIRTTFSVPVPFEVQADVELVRNTNRQGNYSGAGIVIGYMKAYRPNWRILQMDPHYGNWSISAHDGTRARAGAPGKKHRLRARVWADRYEFILDDKSMLVDVPDKPHGSAGVNFGFGTRAGVPMPNVFKYSNVSVRKLTGAPAPHQTKQKERLAYFLDMCKKDPSLLNRSELAWCHIRGGNTKDGMKLINEIAPNYKMQASFFLNTAYALFDAHDHAEALTFCRGAIENSIPNQEKKLLQEATRCMSMLLSSSKDENVRNGELAIKMATTLVKKDKNNVIFLSAMACAQAETGQFSKAVATVKRALGKNKQGYHTKKLKEKLRLFKSKTPYRM